MKVLFVCMGNICRSPTAQGVFEKLVSLQKPPGEISIDSAGTHAYHTGEPPDRRSQMAALNRDVDISGQRARKVTDEDFTHFDLILAMDEDNKRALLQRCPPDYRQRIRLFLEFAPAGFPSEVPDPYYGGSKGFDQVLDMVFAASEGLLDHIVKSQTEKTA